MYTVFFSLRQQFRAWNVVSSKGFCVGCRTTTIQPEPACRGFVMIGEAAGKHLKCDRFSKPV